MRVAEREGERGLDGEREMLPTYCMHLVILLHLGAAELHARVASELCARRGEITCKKLLVNSVHVVANLLAGLLVYYVQKVLVKYMRASLAQLMHEVFFRELASLPYARALVEDAELRTQQGNGEDEAEGKRANPRKQQGKEDKLNKAEQEESEWTSRWPRRRSRRSSRRTMSPR